MQFILVLGYVIDNNQSDLINPILKARLDLALRIYLEQSKQTKIIVSGGSANGTITEASVMSNHLSLKGVPVTDIILEDKSVSTIENIHNTHLILSRNSAVNTAEDTLFIVTSDFHMDRVKIIVSYYFNGAKINIIYREAETPVLEAERIKLDRSEQRYSKSLRRLLFESN